MIIKEVEETYTTDKYMQSGLVAEKQMAFYLKRAFGDDPNTLVLNGVRISQGEDAAQIDHLLLHEFGMIIVESKSVTTEVSINEHGEWMRSFNGTQKGMPSPVLQAKRQGELLKNFLQTHTDVLLKKILGVQMKFDKMPIDIVVAISDTGIIHRPKKKLDELEYVCKADRAIEKIHEIIDVYRKKDSALSLSLGPYYLGKTAREKVGKFLIENHSPSQRSVAPISPPEKNELPCKTEPKGTCKHCSGAKVEILYGKYGYYFKCADCQKNTAIRENCQVCSKQMRLRKDKEQFFIECQQCNSSALYHVNKQSS